ncbi:Carbon catabolite repressor protein 4 like 6 [Apostasia shenzhenica]|uniref:Carbon catabolite repressor protein 4 like 6 n=1 Tax=Apostasia shenzhenica TaxID=1088818 RepID=A0A2I0A0I3_9ASPA|nr:Carbon catabolite repressor protein 4 like 6 [Apostasia shenzhenica]
MRFSSRPLQCTGAGISDIALNPTMSSSSYRARGRRPWHRGFCDRASAFGYGGAVRAETFVSGDSHIRDVRVVNYAYQQGYARDARIPSVAPQQFRPWRNPPLLFRAGPPPKSADHRNWVFAATQPPAGCDRFKVLSYNILADYLAVDHQSKLYYHIPNHILDWEWRKKRLFIEFGLWSPDIMCLQEVDRFCDLEGELTVRGYAGLWKMRTGNAIDGCAIFWRTNRFQLLHEEHIEFSKHGLRNNVAQICVLESKLRCVAEDVSSVLPASIKHRSGGNQVVVCNIHVLYNPKRGEIKIGQVRVLLERAYAVSKTWNDAPVVICGDFNSIPMSPLYKFITEQKLNISGLSRHQISGQYSASLHAQANSDPISYSAQSLRRDSTVSDLGGQQGIYHNDKGNASTSENSPVKPRPDLPLNNDWHKSASVLENLGQDSSSSQWSLASMSSRTTSCSSQQTILHAGREDYRDEESKNVNDGIPFAVDQRDFRAQEIRTNVTDSVKHSSSISCSNSNFNAPIESVGNLELKTVSEGHKVYTNGYPIDETENVNICSFQEEGDTVGNAPSFQGNKEDSNDMGSLGAFSSHPTDVNNSHFINVSEDISTEKVSSATVALGALSENASTGSGSSLSAYDSSVNNKMDDTSKNEDKKLIDCSDFGAGNEQISSDKTFEELSTMSGNSSRHASAADENHFSEICTSESASQRNQSESCNNLWLDETLTNELSGCEEKADPNFFKELLGTEDVNQASHHLCSSNVVLQDESSFPLVFTASDAVKPCYNPYSWSPTEIEAASGNPKSTSVEHCLKLRSAYADVEDYAGTRDSNREPAVTSYNRQFMGTVDYIWCTEALQTVKVLDTIPKHVLRRTPGFPTQKWGSDHIALACELAFSKACKTK